MSIASSSRLTILATACSVLRNHGSASHTNRHLDRVNVAVRGKTDLGPQSGSGIGTRSRRRQLTASEHPIIKTLKSLNERYEKTKENKSLEPRKRVNASLGPGSYETPSQFKKENHVVKGPRWQLSKIERFKTDQKQITTEQHEMLSVEQFRRQKEKARSLAPSNFFRSETTKSYFDEILYHTQSSLKAEIRKKLGYKSSQPAPGSYLAVYNETTPQTRYQFFGSTEERFKDNILNEVGPGDYSIPPGFARQQRKKRIDKTRRSLLENPNETPGPGAYDHSQSFINRRKLSNIEEFGSLQARFKAISNTENDQPLMDEMLRSTNSKFRVSDKKEPPIKLTSPMFRSSTDRDCFEAEKRRMQLPFAEYEVSQNDIGQRLVKKRNYLDHLEFCLLRRPGFDSSQQRFEEKKQQPQVKPPSTKAILSTTKPVSQSSVFKSRDSRNVFDVKSKAPPIGSYDHLPMARKSFNKRYQTRSSASASRSFTSSIPLPKPKINIKIRP